LLDVTVIEDLGVVTLLKDLSYLYDGNIYGHPKCRHYRVERLTATSPERIRIEVDGEPLGSLPLEITVLPKRLKVLAPPV
jgi:diacylglycerol kinase family enzyme